MNIFNSWLVEQPIAHRGLHDKTTPENSLASFAKAIQEGYAIELDVRKIADGTLIVFHDESLSRLTDNDGYIKFLNKTDLDLLTLKGSQEKIPTFKEVLDFIAGRAPILIEIKNEGKVGDLEKSIIEELKEYQGDYAIQSFNPYVLEYFYKHAPHILRGQLAGFFKGEKLSFFKKYALKRMVLNNKVSHPDFISYEARRLPNRFIRKYKKLPLIAWTVKSESEYLKVVKYCDNIIFEGFEPTI